MKPVIALGLILGLTSGCLTTLGDGIDHPPHPMDDQAYWPQHEADTRRFELVNNFATRFQIQVTRLTPQFRSVSADRYRAIFHQQKGVFEAAEDSTGFFVSIYSANNNLSDLQNPDLWNITLDFNQASLAPSKIQIMEPKELWSAFFPSINPWSKEFLILFKLPPITSGEGSANSPTLSLSSPHGSIKANFPN